MGTESGRGGAVVGGGQGGYYDGSDGTGAELLVHAKEWERKGESQLQGGHGAWLRWCTPSTTTPPLPAGRRMQGQEGWAHGEELARTHPPVAGAGLLERLGEPITLAYFRK